MRSFEIDQNNHINIEGVCDSYVADVITKQEEVRRMREKKLKRILNEIIYKNR